MSEQAEFRLSRASNALTGVGLLFLTGCVLFVAFFSNEAEFLGTISSKADLTAHHDRIEFHPAVRRNAASYDDISHWSIESVSGHPVVWLHFFEPYWSLQGLFKRKTIKLEGGREDVEPLVQYFAQHPIMREKFVG